MQQPPELRYLSCRGAEEAGTFEAQGQMLGLALDINQSVGVNGQLPLLFGRVAERRLAMSQPSQCTCKCGGDEVSCRELIIVCQLGLSQSKCLNLHASLLQFLFRSPRVEVGQPVLLSVVEKGCTILPPTQLPAVR